MSLGPLLAVIILADGGGEGIDPCERSVSDHRPRVEFSQGNPTSTLFFRTSALTFATRSFSAWSRPCSRASAAVAVAAAALVFLTV